MRPTKQETDLEFWAKAREHWAKMREAYWLIDDDDGMARADKRLFVAELAYQEAQGLITVYSGRKNPEWA